MATKGSNKNIYFENLLALLIAIEKECPPEVAFKYLDKYLESGDYKKKPRFKWTDKDIEDVIKLKNQGITQKEISSYYGLEESGMCRIVKKGLSR